MDTRRFEPVMQSLYGESAWYIYDHREQRLLDEGPYSRETACMRIKEIVLRDLDAWLREEAPNPRIEHKGEHHPNG